MIAAAFALAVVACLVLSPGAQAASTSGVYVQLYDSGKTSPGVTCDWYAKVDQPQYVLTDGKTNLVLDIVMVPYNGTGSLADTVFKVRVTISDGTTTLTQTADINTSAAKAGSVTFTAANLSALTKSDAGGVMTFTLLSAADVQLDTYTWSGVAINDDKVQGALYGIVPIVISILALAMVLGAVGGMFAKLGSFGRVGGRKKK